MRICTLENTEKLQRELQTALSRLGGGYWNGHSCFDQIQHILEGRAAKYIIRREKYSRIRGRQFDRAKTVIRKFKKQFAKHLSEHTEQYMNLNFGDIWVRHAYNYLNDNIHPQQQTRLLTKMPSLVEYKRVRDFKLKYKRKVKRGPGK